MRLDTRLRQSRIDLAVELVSGPAVRPWVPVFELRGRHGPVLAVATAGTDLVFQPPARSYALRLRRPAMRLSGALPAKPGQALALTAGARGPLVWARWTSADVPGQRLQALSPSFGWTLLLPFDYAYGRELQLVTALWIVALLAPISYWASRSRSLGVPPAVGLLLLSGLGLIPRLTGYPPVHWSEWLAGVTGIAAGWAGHRAAAYFGERCDFLSTKESS